MTNSINRFTSGHPAASSSRHLPVSPLVGRRSLLLGAAAVGASLLSLTGCGGTGEGGSMASGTSNSGGTSTSGDALSQIRERGEMIFATEGTWSPWTYHNDTDELTGFDIEVARSIAERLGVDASFAEGEWDGLFAGLDAGRYDAVANGVSVTPERAEAYDFTEPYAYNRIVVITLDDTDDIASMDDLAGHATGNTISSSYATLAESYGATVTGVDDFIQTIELLERGSIDATLNDEVVFYDYRSQHPDAPLKIAAAADEPTHIALPVRRDAASAELLDAMNDAIADMRATGELAELSQRFFGMDITEA